MSRAREDVITVLHDISSQDRHYEWFKATGGSGNLAAELWTYWLRDAYLPHRPDFPTSFAEQELQKLERFTQFFESRLKEFPSRFEKLMLDFYWRSVVEYAEGLLGDLAEGESGSEAVA